MDKMKTLNPALINGLNRIENLIPTKPADPKGTEGGSGATFKDTLKETLNKESSSKVDQNVKADPLAKKEQSLKFSNHAIERMNTRGISYSPEDLNRLGEAVQKAAAKGSRDTLVLMDDSALIVSVKNNTVVTVMDKNALKENVFTNIDSTIVM